MPSSSNSGSSSSSRLPPKISYSSSSGSESVTETNYRSGSAGGYYKTVKHVPSSRGGPSTVLIQDKK